MDTLAEILEQFNRKERNLLIRDALGCRDRPLSLSVEFRNRIQKALGLSTSIPDDAWWATDYHIDWLAGALRTFMAGTWKGKEPKSDLVKGTQQDFDLVIATGDDHTGDLILIEVKAYGYFAKKQGSNKLERLTLLYDFYKTLRAQRSCKREVRFHFLLCSLKRPTSKLKLGSLPWASVGRMEPAELPYMPLKVSDSTRPILAVTRCDSQMEPNENGKFWCCREVPKPDAHSTSLSNCANARE